MDGAAVRVAVPAVVGEVIRGDRGREGVRDVLCNPGRYGVPELLLAGTPGSTGRLQLLRGKYKPGRTLRAYYRKLRDAPDADCDYCAVTWSLAPGGRSGPAVECLTSPIDPSMPQLEGLTRAERVVSLAEELTDTRLPRVSRARVETLRYRPGQRHVLVARLDSRSIYLKLDRDRSGARAVPTADLVREVLRRHCPDVRAAAPIGFSDTDSVALWWGEQGQTLSRLLAAGTTLGPPAVRRLSAALRCMHERITPTSAGGALSPLAHDAGGEAAAVLGAGGHIAVLLRGIWPLYETLVGEVVRDLQELPPEDLCFAHGDFKSDNILVSMGQARILDFDRSCWADPAMDLGKLMADLAWWCPQESTYSAARRALTAGYGPCDPAVWVRAQLWSVLFRLKIAARRCPVHEHAWPARVSEQVEGALGVLNMVRRLR